MTEAKSSRAKKQTRKQRRKDDPYAGEIESKVVERQQGDGWNVYYKPGRQWEYVRQTDSTKPFIFPDKQTALDYVRDATPEAIVTEVAARFTEHEGKAVKPRVDLIDASFILGLGRVLGDGAKKYSAHNWRHGSKYSERYASLQRHLQAWWSGETLDGNSKENHLYHVATNAMILAYWQLTGRGTDDRYQMRDEI